MVFLIIFYLLFSYLKKYLNM